MTKGKHTSRKHAKRAKLGAGSLVAAVAIVCAASLVAFLAHTYAQNSSDGSSTPASSASAESNDDTITYNGNTYEPNDHLSNYLFLGVDNDVSLTDSTTTAPGESGQADAIYLVSYDRLEETVQIFAIPRDTMTQIESFTMAGTSLGLSRNHLSLQYAYGDGKRTSCELMEEAVSRLFEGLRIDGYLTINLESLSHLTELVGYVDVTVPNDSLEELDPDFPEGATVRLTAENTETFLRRRDIETSQSALARMERQKVFIKAFLARVRELQAEDASTVTSVYEGLQKYMLTNMSNDIFLDLATATDSGDIVTIPGTGTEGELFDEYEVDEDALYELIIQYFYVEQTS